MTENASGKPAFENVDQLADQLMDRADGDQVQLLGPDGLLTQLRATATSSRRWCPNTPAVWPDSGMVQAVQGPRRDQSPPVLRCE